DPAKDGPRLVAVVPGRPGQVTREVGDRLLGLGRRFQRVLVDGKGRRLGARGAFFRALSLDGGQTHEPDPDEEQPARHEERGPRAEAGGEGRKEAHRGASSKSGNTIT